MRLESCWPMTTLRQQLIQELVLRGMSERTQEAYIHQVYHLAKYYRQPPDELSEQQVRDYLFYLARERQLAVSSINQAVTVNCRFTALSGLRLSFRKSAMVLKSGASLPSSQITSTFR